MRIASDGFVLDGELVIPAGGTLYFNALQMRLHPAESRIRRLAAETPALFILFDCLAADGEVLTGEPLVRSPCRAGSVLSQGGARTAICGFRPTPMIAARR